MTITIRNQQELDQALADKVDIIYIESTNDSWLRVEAQGSSRVAQGSSHVVALGSSRVVARDSSHVEAWGSSHVEARDCSCVWARDSSCVWAWDSSRVEAWGSSRVVASQYAAVHLHSRQATIGGQGHIIDVTSVDLTDPVTWCKFRGVTVTDGVAYVYKAVDDDWMSAHGISYAPGSLPEAPDWNTTPRCGGGLHFSPRPSAALYYACDATRFLQVGVRLDEMVCLDDKVKAKRAVVACVEVDLFGTVVEARITSPLLSDEDREKAN